MLVHDGGGLERGCERAARIGWYDAHHHVAQRAIEQLGSAAGNGKFSLRASPFSGDSTGKLYFDAKSHILFGSIDADTQAEFSILLPNMNNIVVGDIIL